MNNVNFYFEGVPPFKLAKGKCIKHIKKLNSNEYKETGNINIIFCNDEFLKRLNREYLQRDYYTDIITFDYVEEKTISGDLFISTERVKDNARKYNVSFTSELARVIFHGILHLIGYNDTTEHEKAEMREKETFYLKYFGID